MNRPGTLYTAATRQPSINRTVGNAFVVTPLRFIPVQHGRVAE